MKRDEAKVKAKLRPRLGVATTKPMSRFWEQLRGLWSGGEARPEVGEGARIGAAGERAAEAHLRANGLRVFMRNWRNPKDEREELDLVALDGDVLVFIEVKTRAAGARVNGYHAVNKRKKAVLLRACRAYLARLRPVARHYRFDIVEVAHAVEPARRAATAAMRVDGRVGSVREGMEVWHYRDVPLFHERANHRHG